MAKNFHIPNPLSYADAVWKKAAGPTQKVPKVKTTTPVQVAGTNKTYANQTAYKSAQNKKLKKKYPNSNIPKDKI